MEDLRSDSSLKSSPSSSAPNCRSLPYRGSYVWAMLWVSIHYAGIIASITCLIIYLIEPGMLVAKTLAVCLGFTAVTWAIAFFKRRAAFCPLCRGTPLINTGALVHDRAVRIWPFNQGVTAGLSILANQKFCCMYCGTSYDLLKSRPARKEMSEMDNL
ncbi:hypothetical protein JIN85_11215 [Luteolibacter pohnpeiensis]|uniref:Uncharacterized protein n=1 Tax=Luteolibacter pohnpeiensis TaxID=454153 RepID=A0A934S6Z1_9BACT|nr:hypothetical protein [Luteolibacter pohnpeiensis]MBK1882988.1 hypothetical protein [Luteolibacter pohnpeiensis]